MKKNLFFILILTIVLLLTGCPDPNTVNDPSVSGTAGTGTESTGTNSDDDGTVDDGGMITEVVLDFLSVVETGGVSKTTDSTALTLTCTYFPSAITVDYITVTGATKGELSGSGASRTLTITDINVGDGENVSVTISAPSGYIVNNSTQTAAVYRLTVENMSIGMDYRGGKIAYILQNGDTGYDSEVPHGLIAAATDATESDSGICWATADHETESVTTSLLYGDGSANTDNIIMQNGIQNDAGETIINTYAAGLARSCSDGGYSDWFLPSIDELEKLNENKAELGNFTSVYYWSSTEYHTADGVWCFAFSTDASSGRSKNSTNPRVRAVRYF